MDPNRGLYSYLIPQSSVTHGRCGLASNYLSEVAGPSDEISLASSWFWNKGGATVRFSASFPEEWRDLKESFHSELGFQRAHFDLWIFRNLTAEESYELLTLLNEQPDYRTIFAANHLMDWKTLISGKMFAELFEKQRAFLCFLPYKEFQDPFLKPLEVLSALEEIPASIRLYIPHLPQGNSQFYRELTAESYHRDLERQNPYFIKTLKGLQGIGLFPLILVFETFTSFLTDGQISKLAQIPRHLEMLVKQWYQKLWNFVRYKCTHAIKVSMLFIFYPLRKTYWFLKFQYQKRLRNWI